MTDLTPTPAVQMAAKGITFEYEYGGYYIDRAILHNMDSLDFMSELKDLLRQRAEELGVLDKFKITVEESFPSGGFYITWWPAK